MECRHILKQVLTILKNISCVSSNSIELLLFDSLTFLIFFSHFQIHVHRSYHTLKDFIPLNCLPADYGGSQKSLKEINEQWKQLYMQEAQFFEDLDKVKITGVIPKRLVEDYSEQESFGIQGSFRKLNID